MIQKEKDITLRILRSFQAFGVMEITVSISCKIEVLRGYLLTSDRSIGLITESISGNGGGLMMLGRSDGVLNRKFFSSALTGIN